MLERVQERLRALREEFRSGQQMLADMEAREAQLRATLTRISGAIQVLEELAAQEELRPGGNGRSEQAATRAGNTAPVQT